MTPRFSAYAPPGMTWRETIERDATHIYFSGTAPPRGLVWVAWALVVLGVLYEILFNGVGGKTTGSVVLMQAFPLAMIAIGGALAWRWRQGGSNSGVLDVGREALVVQRGILLGPFKIHPRDIHDLVVTDNEQDYQVANANYTVSDTAKWCQVTLVTKEGKTHGLACFGAHPDAAYYAARVKELLAS